MYVSTWRKDRRSRMNLVTLKRVGKTPETFRPLSKYYQSPVDLIVESTCFNNCRVDPYGYCAFGCRYCYANDLVDGIHCAFHDRTSPELVRPTKLSYLIQPFETAFKTEKPLRGARRAIQKRVPFRMSAKTDAFQPAEKRYGLSYKFLKWLLKACPDYPVIINTKSVMPASPKYFKLLTSFKNLIYQPTISTMEEKMSRVLEPFVPTPKARLKVAKKFHDVGVRVYARCMPMFPRLTTDDKLISTIRQFADCMHGLMTGDAFITNRQIKDINSALREEGYDIDIGDEILKTIGPTYRTGSATHGRAVSFGAKRCGKWWAASQHLIAKVACHSVGLRHTTDVPEQYVLSDDFHCCGGSGLKGFETLNFACMRTWIRDLQRFGRLRKQDAYKYEAFSPKHEKLLDAQWDGSGDFATCVGVKPIFEEHEIVEYMWNREDEILIMAGNRYGNKRLDEWLDTWRKSDTANPDYLAL